MKFTTGNIDLGYFWYTNFWNFGFQTPPPPAPTPEANSAPDCNACAPVWSLLRPPPAPHPLTGLDQVLRETFNGRVVFWLLAPLWEGALSEDFCHLPLSGLAGDIDPVNAVLRPILDEFRIAYIDPQYNRAPPLSATTARYPPGKGYIDCVHFGDPMEEATLQLLTAMIQDPLTRLAAG